MVLVLYKLGEFVCLNVNLGRCEEVQDHFRQNTRICHTWRVNHKVLKS